MIKLVKKILLSSISVLGVSFLIWMIVLLNPNWVYAKETRIDNVSIFHNLELEKETEIIIKNAIEIIKSSNLFKEGIHIELCLNKSTIYPRLHPLSKGTAYAFLNKTVIFQSEPHFNKNTVEFQWEINNYELRKFDLTYLLAHEFTHNLQFHIDSWLNFKVDFWKLEGHAEYISRQWKNDNKLNSKIDKLLEETNKKHIGIPVFELRNGTVQNLDYFKYGLIIQYLMEEEKMNFQQICEDKRSLGSIYGKIENWRKRKN